MDISTQMANGAVGFAVNDIEFAQRLTKDRPHGEPERAAALRKRFAVRRLKSARVQLKAAIALLEVEND